VWDSCRLGGCTRLLKTSIRKFTQADVVPERVFLAFPAPTNTNSLRRTRSEYAARFITIIVSPQKALKCTSHFAGSLEPCLICYLLPGALGETKTATARTLERAYCSCCPQVLCCLAETNYHREVTRLQTTNTLIQFEKCGLTMKYKCLNW